MNKSIDTPQCSIYSTECVFPNCNSKNPIELEIAEMHKKIEALKSKIEIYQKIDKQNYSKY